MRTRFFWPVILVVAWGVMPASPAEGEEGWDRADRKWIRGPASYLATDEEEKEFKRLKTDAERSAFIEEFWARRDPSEGTPGNEFRDRYYRRAQAADEALRAQEVPAGWKSDPGRVLCLLGQPEEVRVRAGDAAAAAAAEAQVPSRYGGGAAEPTTSAGGEMTFTYHGMERFGLPDPLELLFQQEGLSYRLLTRVDLSTDALRGLDRAVLAEEFPAGAAQEEKLSLVPAAPAAPAAVVPDVPGAVSVQRQALEEMLAGGEAAGDVPFDSTVDFYKTIDNQTYAAVTLALPLSSVRDTGLEPEDLHPVAALQDLSDPENLFLYDSDALFAMEPDEAAEMLRFQAGDGMKPGRYRLATGFVTADGAQRGLHAEEVEVPDFSGEAIRVSSLTLTARWEEVAEEYGELKRPYILGSRKVVPRVDPRLPLNASLTVYFQVYNAGTGPDERPNLRVSYHFYQKRGSRYVKAGTAPPLDGAKERVYVYELPLQGWPAGEYKLKVTVTDNTNGSFAEREIPFRVG